MKTMNPDPANEHVNVLLVGNNPIEMGSVVEKFHRVRSAKIITEIAFDIRSMFDRLMKFQPNFIFIDDNIGRSELANTVLKLSSGKSTKHIPITVLKNSNYNEAVASENVLDFLLKKELSEEVLVKTIRNALRLRKTQQLLYNAYKRREGLPERIGM